MPAACHRRATTGTRYAERRASSRLHPTDHAGAISHGVRDAGRERGYLHERRRRCDAELARSLVNAAQRGYGLDVQQWRGAPPLMRCIGTTSVPPARTVRPSMERAASASSSV